MPNDNRGGSQGGNRNPGQNLSEEDRRKGGEHSAEMQDRDEQGRFAGESGQSGQKGQSGQSGQGGGSRGAAGSTEAARRGGEHSHGGGGGNR